MLTEAILQAEVVKIQTGKLKHSGKEARNVQLN
jgi:hypothetical protein